MRATMLSTQVRFMVCLAACTFAGGTAATEHVVGQKNKNFTVANVEAKIGDEVLFRNDDGVFHNIFSLTNGHSFDLGAYGSGISKTMKLDKPGKIEVECAIHPRMKMVIDVAR